MHVGHDGKVMEEEGQCGQVLNLTQSRLLDVVRPNLHRTVVDHLDLHCLFDFSCNTSLINLVVPRSSTFKTCLIVSKLRCKATKILRNIFAQRGVKLKKQQKKYFCKFYANRMCRNCLSLLLK